MNPELVTTGEVVRLFDRPNPQPIVERRELSASQIEWCERNLKAFTWPRAELMEKRHD